MGIPKYLEEPLFQCPPARHKFYIFVFILLKEILKYTKKRHFFLKKSFIAFRISVPWQEVNLSCYAHECQALWISWSGFIWYFRRSPWKKLLLPSLDSQNKLFVSSSVHIICIWICIYCACLWKEGIISYQKLLAVSSCSYFCPGNLSISVINSVEHNTSLAQLHLKI